MTFKRRVVVRSQSAISNLSFKSTKHQTMADFKGRTERLQYHGSSVDVFHLFSSEYLSLTTWCRRHWATDNKVKLRMLSKHLSGHIRCIYGRKH